jgi:predicted AAA+ superfamily ATPase
MSCCTRLELAPPDGARHDRQRTLNAINPAEAVEEKVSLDRFGLWLGFHNVDQTVSDRARLCRDSASTCRRRLMAEAKMVDHPRAPRRRVAWQHQDLAGASANRPADDTGWRLRARGPR